ncbi:MAG TPA: PQQ-binding-like beta-propeller repeat protein [Streptosporangiaceae bacterium]|nr:PQQ-binding-like beta-propeller repeat protein [Streptosporangiaceae bacterium]
MAGHRHGAAVAVLGAAGVALAFAAGILGWQPAVSDAPAGQARPASPVARASAASSGDPAASGSQPGRSAFRMLPATGPGYLTPGSDPRALPGDVLIADANNRRLLLVDPQGRVRWVFPGSAGSLNASRFGRPDDAFISRDGNMIVATQEEDDSVAVINIATGRVTESYGHLDVPGAAAGYFSHPDDAMLLPGGDLLLADIINCRILILAPGRWHVLRQFGTTSACSHSPPAYFGSPNGAFPMANGHALITEINGDWVDEMSLTGHVYWSAQPSGVAYPSDANEIRPGRYLVTDYSSPGQIVIFDRSGRALWRFRPTGANALNHPSLALALPNGNILVNDDYNDRVIVINPATNRIVWQYGHRGVAGSAPGFLANPDGVDVAAPYSFLMTH